MFPIASPSSALSPVATASTMINILDAQLASGTATDSERNALLQARSLMSKQQLEQGKLSQAVSVFSPGMGNSVSYQQQHNVLVSAGNTSNAGNTYFSALRMSSAIVIKMDIGIGYAHSFLNGIYIYAADGSKQLLKNRNYHCLYYSDAIARSEAVGLMQEAILDSMPGVDRSVFSDQARLLAIRCVADAYELNQIENLQNNLRRLT
jgi:hypothetical protein